MGDAIETFEDIAELLHSSSSSSLFSDNSFLLKNELSFPNCSTHCIAHSVVSFIHFFIFSYLVLFIQYHQLVQSVILILKEMKSYGINL